MFSENIEVVERLLGAFNHGDFAALDDMDPEVELQDEPRMPGAGWNRGHDGAVRWATKLWQSFGRLSFAIDEPAELGETVISHWRAIGEGKRSGVEVAMDGFCVFTMRHAKVLRVEFFETRRSAMEAAAKVRSRSASRTL
jgi:hypothetical protein